MDGCQMNTVRQARAAEAYQLVCPCGYEFEVPAAPIDAGEGSVKCPECSRIGRIEWKEARAA
jgi:hypothetical protein